MQIAVQRQGQRKKMTDQNQVPQEQKQNDKELNFRAQEAKYERMLEQERAARQEAERLAQEAISRKNHQDDEDDDEPYVDKKKLDRKLKSFEKGLEEKIDRRAEEKARSMMDKEKKDNWLRNNPDFYEILQEHSQKFAQRDPELAESILEMPEGFERQKLVYKNIKALGIHKPDVKQPSIQDKVDANRKSPYYQPSGMGSAPYASTGDYSSSGQKNAYDKMQELKNRLRLG